MKYSSSYESALNSLRSVVVSANIVYSRHSTQLGDSGDQNIETSQTGKSRQKKGILGSLLCFFTLSNKNDYLSDRASKFTIARATWNIKYVIPFPRHEILEMVADMIYTLIIYYHNI